MAEDDEQRLPIYELHPPNWLPHTSSSQELGYLGFHPPRPGQVEDQLTAHSLKQGLSIPPQVSAETFTAHDILKIEGTTLIHIGALIDEVFARQVDSAPSIPHSTFRIPTRVTLNDSKRQAWFADLADPDVPLHKLGKSVPHGARGHDLLDLLQSNNVAIPRAVWFLRVFGANETAGLRNKPSYNPTQYSIDWANVVTSYLKKQLVDIALPSAPRLGLNIKQTFKGVFSDSDTREKWILRFTYCLRLLRTFYSEGLVDHRTFLVWIVNQMATCNLAQAGFITRLADEYFSGVIGSHALARPFVDACLAKLAEIETSSAQEFLMDTEELIKTLLRRLCMAYPDAFISPNMWKTHRQLLMDTMTEDIISDSSVRHVQQNSRDVQMILRNNLTDIQRRNESMLFWCHPTHRSTLLGAAIEDIQLLNNISSTTVMEDLHFFSRSAHDKSEFVQQLDMLLTWAITPYQYGEHRPFAASTLLRIWREEACNRATRREFGTPSDFLQDQLFDWLDTSAVANDLDNLRAVSLLYGKLVRHDLFSYANYIQRLIARGEQLSGTDKSKTSRHRDFLRWIPLFPSNSSLVIQRKVALYGARAREIPEDGNEHAIRRELRLALADLFGSEAIVPETTSALLSCCESLLRSPRYEQIRMVNLWLLPLLQKYIASHEREQNILLNIYSISLELMDHTSCYHSILDLTIGLLEHATSLEVLTAVINTFHAFATTWACMDEMARIVSSLDNAYHVWKARGVQSRPLLSLLLEFDDGKYLSMQSRHQITADITNFTMALQPGTDSTDNVPNVLPEILRLANDSETDAPSLLANSLWIKYRKSSTWAWKVWNNTVASLRQLPNMESDREIQYRHALRYGTFLCHVDQHLAFGLDREVLDWLMGPGSDEIQALTLEAWDMLIAAVLYVCIFGAIKTTTLLDGLVYPIWLRAAKISADGLEAPLEGWLRSANKLFSRLLLCEDISDDSLSPRNLLELQAIRSRRRDAYRSDAFAALISKIPVIVVIERNDRIAFEIREEMAHLRKTLSLKLQFRQAAYKSLDTVRSAFEQPLNETTSTEAFNKQLMGSLGLLFHNPGQDQDFSDWPVFESLLSPWKISASMVELQLVLKHFGRELASDSGRWTAGAKLDRLSASLLHHAKSRDEAHYIGQMMRGVDPVVVARFINNGIKHIGDVLKLPQPGSSERLQRASDLLHVLIHVTRTQRAAISPCAILELEATNQANFLAALFSHLPSETLLPSMDNTSRFSQDLVIVLRHLQFQLGFGSTWNLQIKELSNKFAGALFKLAVTHGTSEDLVDPATYSVLIDTLYYLHDVIPCDPKATSYDPFRYYPNTSTHELPPDLPSAYRQQLLGFLPQVPANAAVTNLVNSHRDSHGNLVYDSQVVNQPWEWIENLGDPQASDKKPLHEDFRAREVKNSGSLPLDCFEARVTGDSVLRGSELENKLRPFEPGLSAEPIFTRDWRETRIDCEASARMPSLASKSPVEYDPNGIPYYQGLGRPERRVTPNLSPASTISRTPTGARTSGNSGRQSPGPQRVASKKRKVEEAPSEDEVEAVGAHPARMDVKKTKALTTSKSKGKKR